MKLYSLCSDKISVQWEDRQSIMFLFPLFTILLHNPIAIILGYGVMDIIQTPELILIHVQNVYYVSLYYIFV